jgi:hypothetical protein
VNVLWRLSVYLYPLAAALLVIAAGAPLWAGIAVLVIVQPRAVRPWSVAIARRVRQHLSGWGQAVHFNEDGYPSGMNERRPVGWRRTLYRALGRSLEPEPIWMDR